MCAKTVPTHPSPGRRAGEHLVRTSDVKLTYNTSRNINAGVTGPYAVEPLGALELPEALFFHGDKFPMRHGRGWDIWVSDGFAKASCRWSSNVVVTGGLENVDLGLG